MEIAALARSLASNSSHEDETEAGGHIEQWLEIGNDSCSGARRGEERYCGAWIRSGDSEIGHHDAGPPTDNQVNDRAYVIEERDGRLVGRGTSDMKGTHAVMLSVFRDAEPGRVAGCLVRDETPRDRCGVVSGRRSVERDVWARRTSASPHELRECQYRRPRAGLSDLSAGGGSVGEREVIGYAGPGDDI